ncbi:predicted protein [Nematostella vectensis]|uniref:Eukaryotic translation initiation factor 3 subunit D n=1 Tax=Nematostella vectensis TaxID=45351 RepID=EIF3D_NEMVE|nr:eukaryotic translation initiation factor 3 subunit D [Nematostella vectensis]A7SMR1.1 RecName: Full=Eukaryotic translation initiation factor 3 subunit D; Short=eIF3d; AltName: Full=Eukaryotic translation initiation factor 3 subunit 7 [Nematostella vectensis]EDO35013.1 predicted protein [Nematostella vectensis]|eukprot:XP_001627113.1 predicted protein [Nematostella vectensis]
MAGKAKFCAPEIQDNPDGWGPCSVPTAFKDIPYQPFSKADRLGKVSDWTGSVYQDRRYANKYQSQFGTGNQMFSYYHEEDETSFQLVDTSRTQRPGYMRNRNRFNQRGGYRRDNRGGRFQGQGGNMGMQNLSRGRDTRNKFQRKMQRNWGGGRHWSDKKTGGMHKRVASVTVREEWKVLEDGELDFPRLSKLNLPNVEEPETLYECGSVEYYDKAYDRVTTKNEVPLVGVNRVFHKVTTTDDPIISKLLSQGNVFATDAIISTLMTCTRSNYSWDIVVQRVGSKLFFDKRDDSEFDLLTVGETANDLNIDETSGINTPTNLSLEATFINQNFSQQVLKRGEVKTFDHPNPFVTDEDDSTVASVCYRYRKWDLGDGIQLIVRCEHDAIMQGPRGETCLVNIKTLNEWDPKMTGVDWRQKLDSQRGAVLATELKNNSCKLAKWTANSILAGSEYLKLGYVSRVNFLDTSKHTILGTQQFRPREFATQIALNMDNAWGVLRCIIDICMKQPEGKLLILKDPSKGVIRIYDIPNSTFETDEEDDDDDEDDVENDDGDDEKDEGDGED